MKRQIVAGVLSLALMLSALFSLSGCDTAQAADLMTGVKVNDVSNGVYAH